MGTLKQINTIHQEEFNLTDTMVSSLKDKIREGVGQFSIAFEGDKWVMSFPSTEVVRSPSPKRERKRA